MTREKRRLILLISILVFVALASFAIFYSNGYVLDNKFNLSRRGGLYITSPLPDSKIYINNEEKKSTGMFNNGYFVSNLKPGEYSILIAKDGFWPWAKTVEVKKGLVSEVMALTVPQDLKGEIVMKGKFKNIWASPNQKIMAIEEITANGSVLTFYSPEKNEFLTPFSTFTTQLLNFKNPITFFAWAGDSLIFKSEKGAVKAIFNLSENSVKASYVSGSEVPEENEYYTRHTNKKDQKIWWTPETSQIFTEWLNPDKQTPYYICGEESSCENKIEIFYSQFEIRNIDFFPGRKDAVIMAVGNGVFAYEIDGRGGRLIYPIYKGKSPTFASFGGENYIYILDEETLLKAYLK